MLEEAGLHVRVGDVLSHVTNPDTRGRPICFHTVTYRSTEHDPTTRVVLAPEEHDHHVWASRDAVGEHDLVWHVRRALAAMDHEPGRHPGAAK